ncbi:hypothetical protein AA0473_2096 [Acetobacter orleanensis NRIC 0473]|nr:hypothetical protein AA0473_2096 [Acetobacter orleanensis NRIC 0473]
MRLAIANGFQSGMGCDGHDQPVRIGQHESNNHAHHVFHAVIKLLQPVAGLRIGKMVGLWRADGNLEGEANKITGEEVRHQGRVFIPQDACEWHGQFIIFRIEQRDCAILGLQMQPRVLERRILRLESAEHMQGKTGTVLFREGVKAVEHTSDCPITLHGYGAGGMHFYIFRLGRFCLRRRERTQARGRQQSKKTVLAHEKSPRGGEKHREFYSAFFPHIKNLSCKKAVAVDLTACFQSRQSCARRVLAPGFKGKR